MTAADRSQVFADAASCRLGWAFNPTLQSCLTLPQAEEVASASSCKAEVARCQRGTALALHLRDQDPFSVHVLASAGAELAESLAEVAGRKPIRDFALASWPGITGKMYYHQKKLYANAMKHMKRFGRETLEDEQTLSNFSEVDNDVLLWDG